MTQLAWFRQAPLKPNSKQMLEHIDRLRAWRALDLPSGIDRQVHQNRLLKITREASQMTSADLMRFGRERRYVTLVALAVEATATITDEVIGLLDRIVGKLFNAAKHKHQEQFQADGKAINEKLWLGDTQTVRAGAAERTRIACSSSRETGSRCHRTVARKERSHRRVQFPGQVRTAMQSQASLPHLRLGHAPPLLRKRRS